MKLRLALAAATCLALPVMAHAQPVTGPYVSLEGGTSIASPIGLENRTDGTSAKMNFRNSYAFASSVGYGFGNGFRVEVAGNFYRNTVHKFSYNGGDQTLANGGMNTYGPMVNALYDMDIGLPIFPYVGAGVGYQWQKMNTDLTSEFDGVSGTKGSFAYNIIAGIAYPLPWVPGLSATAEYKFMQLVESRNYDNPVSGPDVWSHVGQSSSSTFLLGLRYQIFNPPPAPPPAPAPAPVAAPAPAPARTFLVFFDWDKYNLTPRATEIISEAAADSKTASVTTLQVSGFTDTSGTPEYNLGLSERRAKAVAAQLETDGVPASEIEIHAFGDTHLLVATGPGVREPQNRRVEIVLQ
jgi:OOP family OmpA-OmpF porin